MLRRIFVCLFLLPFTIYANVNYESEVVHYEQAIKTISKEQAPKVSKEINTLWKQVQQAKKETVHLEKQFIKNHSKDKKKLKQVKKQIRLLQSRNTLSSFGIRAFFRRRKNQKRMDQFIETKQTLQKKVNQQSIRIRKTQRLIVKQKDWITRLETCQKELAQRFQSEFQTIQNEGKPNRQQIIPGDKNLPVFGGAKVNASTKQYACPLEGNFNLDTYSQGWIPFVQNGTISAGTWSYPGGGLHLGLDIAAPLYSPIRAGANGIVLYADAPFSSNNGYLGNYCGWPPGGGNTISMLMAVDNQLYAVSLFHLSNQLNVVAGQQIRQGDLIAKSGNSGNSTGPHVHIEVFRLNVSVQQAVSYFRQGADFSWGCGWNQAATCSSIACRLRPETVF